MQIWRYWAARCYYATHFTHCTVGYGSFYFLLKVAHFYRASHFSKWSSVKVLTQNVAFAIWLMTGHCILMNKRNSLSEGCFLAFFSKAFENRSPPTTFYKCNEISRIPYRFTISTQGPPHLVSFNAIQTLGSTKDRFITLDQDLFKTIKISW